MPSAIDGPRLAAVRALSQALSDLGLPGVVIGGIAVSLVAGARYTKDVDALVVFDNANASDLLEALEPYGFVPRFAGMAELAKQARMVVLRHIATGVTVDIALGCMPFEEEVIHRAAEHREGDFAVRLPTPEDLVILKAIANREKDREDIRQIARVYPDMDRKRIERWVRDYGELLETPDLWDQIKPLLV